MGGRSSVREDALAGRSAEAGARREATAMAGTPESQSSRPVLPRRELTTPRSAAIAGILFAVLLGTSIILLRLSVPSRPEDAGEWLADSSRRRSLAWALNLVPFAGIAFL